MLREEQNTLEMERDIYKFTKKKEKIKHLFFPSANNFKYIYKKIKKCRQFLLVCVYQISHKKLVNLLIKLSKNGRNICLIIDYKQGSTTTTKQQILINYLLKESDFKIKIVLNDNINLMHSKFWVIDGYLIGIGSANWTYQAFLKNFENVTLIRSKNSAEQFIHTFEDIWNCLKQVILQGQNFILIDRSHELFRQPFQNEVPETQPFELMENKDDDDKESAVLEISKSEYQDQKYQSIILKHIQT